MKIYFAYTIRGDRSRLEIARKLVDALKAKGHDVITEIFLSDDAENTRGLSKEEIFQRNIRWLQECDVLVSEVSGSSFGIGFEIAYIIGSMNKKAFVFYEKNLEDKISIMATGNTHQNAAIYAYNDFEDIRKFIDENF